MMNCTHLIYFKKRTAKDKQKYFVVASDDVNKRTKFTMTDGITNVQGFWA